MNVGVIGCGVVGEAHARMCEMLGHKVYRNDVDENKGGYPIEFIKSTTEIIFLCLPTPSNADGIKLTAFDDVMPQLKGFDGLVTIKSTVLPHTCEAFAKQYDLKLCHNPEFLTEANAVLDSVQPDKIIIGTTELCAKEGEEEKLLDLYQPFIDKGVSIYVTDSVTSELSKYASNCFLAMKVSFANEMKDMCDWIEADYDVIRDSLYDDSRIGKTHLDVTEKRGWGGMCFPKDTVALHNYCEKEMIDDKMLLATILKNTDYRNSVEEWWDENGKQLI